MQQGRFQRFHHITFVVENLDQAEATWEKVLGGAPVDRRDEDAPRFVRRVQFNAGDAWFELAEPIDSRSPLWGALKARGEGPYSVTVTVDDLDATVTAARSAGATFADSLATGTSVFVAPDSVEGVLLELTADDTRAAGPQTWKAIRHIVVPTPDMNDAAGKYERLFGGEAEPPEAEAGMPLRSRHYMVGEQWFGFAQPFSPDHAVARFLRDRGQRIFAIGITTESKEATAAGIKERGGSLMGPGLTPAGGQIFISPKTASGTLIDIH